MKRPNNSGDKNLLQVETQEMHITDTMAVNRGSYMSAHVLLNLLNELGKRDKMRGLSH